MTEPRRLRGHKATATCCIASRDRSGVVATAGEDGCICLFDMRCKDAQHIAEVAQEPISSLSFNPGNEDIMYVSCGNEVKCFDLHNMASAWTPFKSYTYNKEEINQLFNNEPVSNQCRFHATLRAAFLASTDDGGDVKIIDIRQHCLYKTLRAGHSSICSSVQFIPWRSWEVITGGLDSKLVMWDFSKGRPVKIVDFGLPDTKNSSNGDTMFKSCIRSRNSKLAVIRSKTSAKARKGSSSTSKDGVPAAGTEILDENARKRLHLDYSVGGHAAAVSCVAFSLFGEKGKLIISGGNDKSVKVWDCSKYDGAVQTGGNSDVLRLNINLSKKVNWLCTTPTDSENLVVCDTTKVVKAYSVS
ncbi:TRANSDUCIN/WD40 REPEAT-LIKE SUPERFAMILY PROTEIN [Salix purpurea]|uniref:TRANSDUCIN/WD40 REPEAT-LIKE SUPERFAMILY PROTEIN n=1 Tax=Salix purpurea TaxID=77065 RepID=A0A9Q0WMF9_SALPP|nr:TRANSDUCIN/WD40 REPEAT-LIKE SUPERFAMILY PROTEIN [Salix purpurea]